MTSPTLSNLARRALVPLLLIGTVLAGCTSNPEQRVVDVAIDQADFGLVVGESSAPLTATVDAEAGTSTAVTWSSGDEGVATVAASGVVTGANSRMMILFSALRPATGTCRCANEYRCPTPMLGSRARRATCAVIGS